MVIEKMIRENVVDFETGIAFATNPGNLRLQLTDLNEHKPAQHTAAARPAANSQSKPSPDITDLEFVR